MPIVKIAELDQSSFFTERAVWSGDDWATVRRYVEEPPPEAIDVWRYPSGALVVLGGHRRVEAARLRGEEEIEARFLTQDEADNYEDPGT